MKNYFLILVAATMLGITSCDKEGKDASLDGDVYLFTEVSGQDTLFGLSIHAYSFAQITSVTATPQVAPETTYQLRTSQLYPLDFYYDTPSDELSKEMPPIGLYTFSASFKNGKTDEAEDMLYADVIYPPQITQCKYDSSQKTATVQWNKSENADVYVVKLYNDNTIVFLSSSLDDSTQSFSFSASSDGWMNNYVPVAGKAYKLVISAFEFEPDGDNYNVQASTNSSQTLTWGN